nr:MAG TPA: hypothetical protein [Caudoviricetes sp.]
MPLRRLRLASNGLLAIRPRQIQGLGGTSTLATNMCTVCM